MWVSSKYSMKNSFSSSSSPFALLSSVGPWPILVFLPQLFNRPDRAPHNFGLNLGIANGDHAGGVVAARVVVQHRVSVRIGIAVVVEVCEASAVLARIRRHFLSLLLVGCSWLLSFTIIFVVVVVAVTDLDEFLLRSSSSCWHLLIHLTMSAVGRE